MKTIILASASPRRKELLKNIGILVKVVPSKIEERLNPRLKPKGQVQALSLQKVEKVAELFNDAIIIGADTVVVLDDEIIGKPKSVEEAKRTLRKLSGKTHSVMTGFTILDTKTKKKVTDVVVTNVVMRDVTENEIDAYLKLEDVLDNSGSYAVQGRASVFFEKIDGDFFNIVGLPLFAVSQTLKKFGVKVF